MKSAVAEHAQFVFLVTIRVEPQTPRLFVAKVSQSAQVERNVWRIIDISVDVAQRAAEADTGAIELPAVVSRRVRSNPTLSPAANF